MPTQNIPLSTINANQVIGPLTENAVGLTTCTLSLNRNVGSSSLDSQAAGVVGTLLVEWSHDGGSTFSLLESIGVPGGPIFANKAQTIRVEVSAIEIDFFPGTTHIRGTYTNGANAVSVSGSFTQI
jgi:hypothetical protein